MKKFLKTITLAIVIMCVFACGSMAYATDVQIDGKTMELRHEPINVDGRVYLPLRNVFELLGARVVWDSETNEIVATKDEIEVSFVLGDTSAFVSNRIKGTKYVPFYGTPFVVEGTTYVPIRFAADALGLNVGWDNDTQTVLIVDNDILLARYVFETTITDKMWDFFGRYNEGGYFSKGHLNMIMTLTEDGVKIPIVATGEYDALKDVKKNVRIDLNCELDFTEAIETEKVSVEELKAMGLDSKTNIIMEYVADAKNQRYYFRSEELNNLLFDLYPSTWIKMDLKAQSTDEESQETVSSQICIKDIVEETVKNYPLTSVDDYAFLQSLLINTQGLLDDENFVYNKEKGCYENQYVFDDNAVVVKIIVDMETTGVVTKAEISVTYSKDGEDVHLSYTNDFDNNVLVKAYISTDDLWMNVINDVDYVRKENHYVSLNAVNEGNMIDYSEFKKQMDSSETNNFGINNE